MVELSVIIVTTTTENDKIPAYQELDETSPDIEIIVRRDDGIATARNEGIKRASGEKIVFIDDDAIPHHNYLEAASKALSEHDIVAGRVIQAPPVPKYRENSFDQGQDPKQTNIIVGCNMGIRQSVFEDTGVFNPAFSWGHEEEEWKARARAGGHDIHYAPEMVVTHHFYTGRREYWKKQYRKGIADAYLWEISGTSRSTQIKRSLPLNMRKETITETIGRVARKIGRLTGNKYLLTNTVSSDPTIEYGDFLNIYP